MSFPHRTAFYDKRQDKIIYPDEVNVQLDAEIASFMECQESQIPLASTGLEDMEGNEIFEGDIVKLWESNYVMEWDGYGSFTAKTPDLNCCLDQSEIIGHALTDPELVPDSFDVEEYFEL